MKRPAPPKFLLRWLKSFCKPSYHADIEGDLHELYDRYVTSYGVARANLLLFKDVLLLFRPGIIKPIFQKHPIYSNTMIMKDVQFAFRALLRNKLIAGINTVGLSIGISACLIIFLIAHHELTYDKFQRDGDRIFRVYSKYEGPSARVNRGVPTGIASVLQSDFTGIEALTQFHVYGAKVAVPGGLSGLKHFDFYHNIIFAGPEYFDVFNYYQWLAGSKQHALKSPHQVVLTESRAKIYFGELPLPDYLGKEIYYSDSLKVVVAGVVADIEENTDFNFTDFISYSTTQNSWLKEQYQEDVWDGTTSATQLFIKLNALTTADKIMQQMPHVASVYKERNQNSEWSNSPQLQPLSDLHFNQDLGVFDSSRSIPEKSTLYVLMAIAILLLTIAVINFVNLETAQASRRAKEVGVRKVLGSSRGKLVGHFLIETFLLTFFSLVLSTLITVLAMGMFSEFMPPDLKFDPTEPSVLTFLGGCLVVVTFLAGLYPAASLSAYSPARALKNLSMANNSGSRSAMIRKGLTVFQFGFAYSLIVATLVISQQINFMLDKDLGYATTGIVYFHTPWNEPQGKRDVLSNKIEQIEGIDLFSVHQSPPTSSSSMSSVLEFDNGKELLKNQVFIKVGDTSYLRLYNIQLVAGRNVQPVDSIKEYIINETYLKTLGFSDPRDVIGKAIKDATIVGVMKDFHSKSLHTRIEPMLFRFGVKNSSCVGIRFPMEKVSSIAPVMNKVEAAWKEVYPDEKFKYTFLEESIQKFYENEQRVGLLARTATGIAIIVSCLGLFGLSSFTVVQRTKEIGIRKALGATANNILILLSRDFVSLVIVAFIISAPFAWLAADWWLDEFAYRIDVAWWVYVVAGLGSLGVAVVAISSRTVGAAHANPVDSLRNE